MIDLQQIRTGLTHHQPQLLTQRDFRRAAVAMLLREQAGETEVLFIRRAEYELDPWSGDLAFPGGVLIRQTLARGPLLNGKP
jgi:hypothetical protein